MNRQDAKAANTGGRTMTNRQNIGIEEDGWPDNGGANGISAGTLFIDWFSLAALASWR
jgi:hypothetical protein